MERFNIARSLAYPTYPTYYSTLSFTAGVAVVPGQPISVSWRFWSTRSIQDGSLTATFSVLHPSAGEVIIENAVVVPVSGGPTIDGLPLVVIGNRELTPIDVVVGRSLYDIVESELNNGLDLKLSLRLQGVDSEGNEVDVTFTQKAGYLVVQDAGLDWTWTPLASADWKSLYQVAGILANRCQFTALNITRMNIAEQDATDGTSRTISLTSPGSVAADESAEVSTADIVQDWRWFGTFEPSLSAPTVKQFVYTAEFQGEDPYGNIYPAAGFPREFQDSDGLTVTVSVSQEKLNHQMAADGEFQATTIATTAAGVLGAAAAAAFEVPIAAAILGIAAAAASATASTLQLTLSADESAANDPIEADFNLRVYVEVPSPQLPTALQRDDSLPNIKLYLALIRTMWEAENAIYTTLPRVLGAHIANDENALKRQVGLSNDFIATVRSIAAELEGVAQKVAHELDSVFSNNTERLSKAIMMVRSSGLGKSISEMLLDNGMTADMVAYADEAARSESYPNPFFQVGKPQRSTFSNSLINVAKLRSAAGSSVVTMAQTFLARLSQD